MTFIEDSTKLPVVSNMLTGKVSQNWWYTQSRPFCRWGGGTKCIDFLFLIPNNSWKRLRFLAASGVLGSCWRNVICSLCSVSCSWRFRKEDSACFQRYPQFSGINSNFHDKAFLKSKGVRVDDQWWLSTQNLILKVTSAVVRPKKRFYVTFLLILLDKLPFC